jgi:hypothetical protein
MKQTAVEWLVDEYFGGIENCTPDFRFHIQQAKEMEREQIIDFGYDIAEDLACGKYRDKKHMEERYDEFLTYNQEEQ